MQWQVPPGAIKLSVLAVGGGGGGAPGLGNAGGGGGAGGLVYVDDYLKKFNARPSDSIEVRVGMPGPIVSMTQGRRGLPGSNTVFGKIVALGGGGGGRGQNLEAVHHASSGGSAGGGTMWTNIPVALQPAESGIGIGFGHNGGGAVGGGGGGAGGPGTLAGKGGGGIGLQGIPQDLYIDKKTGFVTADFDATNSAYYSLMFRDLFGSGIGEDGWFAGGGAYNAPGSKDRGGCGGGSAWDAMPHTGGGGGGSTHGYQGGRPGIGGSGVVLVRYQFADGSAKVQGWARVQPDDFLSMRILREPDFLTRESKYEAALESLDKQKNLDKLPEEVRVTVLRAYGQIYLGQGREIEALARFKEALELEKNDNQARVDQFKGKSK
ncbi:MAG: tetratricopeptide repeat protein [Kiritimatiellia bacterium]